MKTAEEFYNYCSENEFGQGVSRSWGIKHFQLVVDMLQPDEDVKMCFLGIHNYKSPTTHDNTFAYAITNKRIIMAQKKMFGQVTQTVQLDYVNDITTKSGLMFGIVMIDTMKETIKVAVDKDAAMNISSKVHDLLLELKHNDTSANGNVSSGADELLKYKQLLDMGAITQDEYDAKKSKILNS